MSKSLLNKKLIIESGKDEHKGSVDKAIKASKEKECVKESIELTRLRELTLRVIR
jgi:hypothetical protein